MPDVPNNSRLRDHGRGITSEMIANQVQLFYEPTTQHARVVFNGSPYVSTDDGMLPLGMETDIVHVDLQDRMTMTLVPDGVVDPVTGLDLSKLTLAGFMIAVKYGYDYFHNERAAMLADMQLPPEPDPELP